MADFAHRYMSPTRHCITQRNHTRFVLVYMFFYFLFHSMGGVVPETLSSASLIYSGFNSLIFHPIIPQAPIWRRGDNTIHTLPRKSFKHLKCVALYDFIHNFRTCHQLKRRRRIYERTMLIPVNTTAIQKLSEKVTLWPKRGRTTSFEITATVKPTRTLKHASTSSFSIILYS